MNISLQPHGASQQSQRLCPSTATSSCTEKALLPAAGISSPPRWPFSPFLSRQAGTSVPLVPGHHGPAGLRGAGAGHLALAFRSCRCPVWCGSQRTSAAKSRVWKWFSVTCNGLLLLPPRPISSSYLFGLQTSSLLN